MAEKRLKSSILFGLGGPGTRLVKQYDRVIGDRYFLPEIEYPNFLTESIVISPSAGKEEDNKIKETIEIDAKEEDSPQAIVGSFDEQAEKVNSSLTRALNRTTDASKRMQLKKETGLEIEQGNDVFFIAPTCDNFARNLIIPLVKSIKPTLDTQEQKNRISGVLLLPRLFEQQKNYDPKLYKARSYVTLEELNHFLTDYNTDKWRGRPVDRVWLIDGYNSDGEFLGGIRDSLDYFADALATLVVDRPHADTSGFAVGGDVDIDDEKKFYSSFGISNLNFPRAELLEEFRSRVKQQLFGSILSPKPANRKEIEPDVRKLIDNSLSISEIPSRLERDKYCRRLRERFPEVDKELGARKYISEIEDNARKYEKTEYRNVLSDDLQPNKETITQDMATEIRGKVGELINSHRNRINYSLAFCDVLLGREGKGEYLEGRGWEEESNLALVREKYEDKLNDRLDVSKYDKQLENIKEKVEELNERISELKKSVEEDNKKKSGMDQSTRDKISRLKNKRSSQIKKKKGLEEDLSWYKENKDKDHRAKSKLLKRRKESTIEILKGNLKSKSEELENAKAELKELFEKRKEILSRLLLQIPAPLLVVVAGLLYYLSGNFLTTTQFTGTTLLVYSVFGLWFYYQGIRKEILDKQTKIRNLEEEIQELKTKVSKKYRDYFTDRLEVWMLDSSLEIIGELEQEVSTIRNKISSFLEKSQDAYKEAQEREVDLPGSVFEISSISEEELGSLFEDLCKDPEDPEEGVKNFLNNDDKDFSEYVIAENGFESLKKDLYDFSNGLAQKLSNTTVEEILFDYLPEWKEERVPVNYISSTYPVSPYVSLKQTSGAEEINLMGVANKDETIIDGFMKEQGLAPEPEFFSHFRVTKITIMNLLYYFSLKDLKQFKSFKSSYKIFMSNGGSAEDIFPPQFSKENLHEIELKKNEELLRLIVLGLGLSIINKNEEGLYYQDKKLGKTVEQTKERLSGLDMADIKTEIENEIEMAVTWETVEEKRELKKELNNFDIPDELGDVASEIIQRELSKLEKIS